MIHTTFYLTCDACNKYQAPHYGETKEETIQLNHSEGWTQRIVPNGGTWDICPTCLLRDPSFLTLPTPSSAS